MNLATWIYISESWAVVILNHKGYYIVAEVTKGLFKILIEDL